MELLCCTKWMSWHVWTGCYWKQCPLMRHILRVFPEHIWKALGISRPWDNVRERDRAKTFQSLDPADPATSALLMVPHFPAHVFQDLFQESILTSDPYLTKFLQDSLQARFHGFRPLPDWRLGSIFRVWRYFGWCVTFVRIFWGLGDAKEHQLI